MLLGLGSRQRARDPYGWLSFSVVGTVTWPRSLTEEKSNKMVKNTFTHTTHTQNKTQQATKHTFYTTEEARLGWEGTSRLTRRGALAPGEPGALPALGRGAV